MNIPPTPTPALESVATTASFWAGVWSTIDTYLLNTLGKHTGLLLAIVVFIVFVRPLVTAFIKAYWTKEARPPWATALLATFGVLHMFYRWIWGLTLARLGLAMPPEEDAQTVSPSAIADAVKRQEGI